MSDDEVVNEIDAVEDLQRKIDVVVADMQRKIDEFGWGIVGVGAGDGEPTFSYTVGLTAKNLPEMSIYGLPPVAAAALLNDVATAVVEGYVSLDDQRLTGFLSNDYELAPVAMTDAAGLTMVKKIYGSVNGAVQLVFPDSQHRMPWDAGYDIPPESQPVKGEIPVA